MSQLKEGDKGLILDGKFKDLTFIVTRVVPSGVHGDGQTTVDVQGVGPVVFDPWDDYWPNVEKL